MRTILGILLCALKPGVCEEYLPCSMVLLCFIWPTASKSWLGFLLDCRDLFLLGIRLAWISVWGFIGFSRLVVYCEILFSVLKYVLKELSCPIGFLDALLINGGGFQFGSIFFSKVSKTKFLTIYGYFLLFSIFSLSPASVSNVYLVSIDLFVVDCFV